MADPVVAAGEISWARVALGLTVVFAMIAALAVGLKWMALRGWGIAAASSAGKRRLRMVESLPLDARRRLVIVRCDEREHLLLLGNSGGDVVVESGLPAVRDEDGKGKGEIKAP